MRAHPSEAADILAVDDKPANLQLLSKMLGSVGSRVRPVPNGRLALQAARSRPPHIILLDINMPEMDGYAVCGELKADPVLAEIPVIFLSARTDTQDKLRGFACGAVDYITKPFQFEEVRARIETHLELRRLRLAESELLEQTLGGAVQALVDVLGLASPLVVSRLQLVRDLARHVARKLDMTQPWQLETAAMLRQIGCIALPPDTLDRVVRGAPLSAKELEMVASHPESAYRIVASIPRLEVVAQMIRHQYAPHEIGGDVRTGAQLLQALAEVERRINKGQSLPEAVQQTRADCSRLAPAILDALADFAEDEIDEGERAVSAADLQSGMVLIRGVRSSTGAMILSAGRELTPGLIDRLRNLALANGLQEPLHVCGSKGLSQAQEANAL